MYLNRTPFLLVTFSLCTQRKVTRLSREAAGETDHTWMPEQARHDENPSGFV